MSKDGLLAFEAAVDFIADRVPRMGMCPRCERKIERLLSALSGEMKTRKVERIEQDLGRAAELFAVAR